MSLPARGDRLDDVGAAERWLVADDAAPPSERAEAWHVSETVARRLVDLGGSNVGGFTDAGEPGWVLRRRPRRTAHDLGAKERLSGDRALTVILDVARALDACERAALFPGPLRPSEVAIEEHGTPSWLVAESLVRALVGADGAASPQAGGAGGGSSGPSPRWTPPEQAAGAAWDNAANRYVLGLVAYRLLAGVHPFRGGGLRRALDAQAAGEAPPFQEEVARELRPGVTSFVLRMLDRDPERRPSSADAIVARCTELLGRPAHATEVGDRAAAARGRATAATRAALPAPPAARPVARAVAARAASASSSTTRGSRRARARLAWVPLAIGGAAAAAALAFAAPRGTGGGAAASATAPVVGEVRPIAATTSSACASCHPREVAEWQRSVMAHAGKSPLYGALESEVEEQVGRDAECPNGAGALRKVGADACRDRRTGIAVTGSGGEHWCVNCHAPGENLSARMPAWSAFGDASSRAPMKDLLPAASLEGISCAGCHQTIGPVGPHRGGGGANGAYEGNATWRSVATGAEFLSRPEDLAGRSGIANSGYLLDATSLVPGRGRPAPADLPAHLRPSASTSRYLGSSAFCGACHDVRLFGSDVLGASERGEHFKRLRNAYSEWRAWADGEERAGRSAASCQDCHMSLFPGTCEPGAGSAASPASAGTSLIAGSCPSGTHFVPRRAGERGSSGDARRSIASHYFTSVDVPLTPAYPDTFADDSALDAFDVPVGLRARRDMLLRKAFDFAIASPRRTGRTLEIPIEVENTGAGHRVPAGFSQEREIWVELSVEDARGGVVYEVGKIARDDEDLHDKTFVRVNTSDALRDANGRPLGVFGADVADGPDVPRWSPNPSLGGTTFRGRGLVNFQNGFLRCVRCIGTVDASGACQPGPGQGATRADRFDDGAYDADTGECRSNLTGRDALFETYFPVGALDAERGVAKAPDAIIDTRSAPPGVPITYTYVLDAGSHPAPFTVRARLRFRAFPPYLVRAFADYEAQKDAERLRPSGPQVTASMLRRIDVVDLAEAKAQVD